MTPLEFVIQARNAEANASVDQFAQKIEGMKAQTEDLYEGPAREMKIRTEIEGMIKDMAMGETATGSLINAFSRLSEVARFAGPVSAIIATVVGITDAEYNAYTAAIKFSEAYKDAMAGDVQNMSLEQINETLRKLDEAEKKYQSRGWLERIMEGSAGAKAQDAMDSRRNDLLAAKDSDQARTIDDQTALKDKGDTAQKIAGIEAKYQALIDQAQNAGQFDTAMSYMNARRKEIEDVKEAETKANDEVAARKAKVTSDLEAELAKAQKEAAEAAAGDSIDALTQRYNDLLHQIDAASGDDKIKLQIEAEDLRRKILDEQRQGAADAATKKADEEAKAQDAALKAQQDIETLRRATLKAELDSLDKQARLIVLRAEAAKLVDGLRGTAKDDADPRTLAMRKMLFDVQKDIQTLSASSRERLPLDNFEQAGGRYAGVNYNGLSNDRANRSEAQRDKMIDLLNKIASRSAASLPDAFS